MKIKLLLTLFLCLCLAGLERAYAQTPPVISSFSPSAAASGASVMLTGTDFNITAANNIVFFGGIRAVVSVASATSLTVTVPANAPYGPISVLNTANGLSAVSLQFFTPTFSAGRPSPLAAGDFTLEGHISSQTPTRAYGMTSADLDNDGKPELVLTNSVIGNNSIYVRRNTSTASAISFASPLVNEATGTDRLEGRVSIGDIDGDEVQDIVASGYGSDNFVVMRNTGSLSGFSPTIVTTEAGPVATALGDLDADGKLDVVVVNYTANMVSVFRNTSTLGAVSFAAAATFTTGGQATRLVIADFNADGKVDVLVSRNGSDLIRVFQNNTSGSSISFTTSDIPVLDHPSALTAGDLDGDGDLDVIVNSNDLNGSNLGILTNISTTGISFSFQQIDVGSHQEDASLADMNGDGKPDVLLATSTNFGSFTYRIMVLSNISTTGGIAFSPRVELQGSRSPLFAIAADMNSDGRPDLITSNQNTATLSIYRNTLQYPPAITSFSPAKAATGASVVLTGSGFNSTMANNVVYFGPVKAVVTAASANSLTVTVPAGATHSLISVLNTVSAMSGLSSSKFLPVFTPNKPTLRPADIATRVRIITVSAPYTVTNADFDGDGKPDLLTNSSNITLSIHPNTSSSGTISFGTPTSLTTVAGARYTGIGDVDGDGKLDIAVPNLTDNTVSIFRNAGSGTINFDAKVDIATGAAPVACAFADFDGDGRPELIVSNYNEDKISVFRNTTSGSTVSFAPKVDFTVGISPVALSVNDFDGDGKLDLAVSVRAANKLVILRNTGSGSIAFATPFELATSNTPWMLQSGDLDGDGKADIAVPNNASSNITIFRNISSSGTTAFEAGASLSASALPRGLSLGDMNGDGRPDMVAANESAHTLSVFANTSSNGSISFASPIGLTVPSGGSGAVILADFDGDGKADISTAESSSNAVSIFRNVLVAAPTVQASGINFSSTTGSSTTINWTSGNGDSRILCMKAGNTGAPAPVDESTYTANAAFGSGSQIAATGWYAVYKGTGSTVNISGLTAASDYRVMVVEYNAAAGLELYQTTSATNNPVLLSTPSTDATLSGLSLSSGSLSPAFASGTTSYSVTVNPGTASITATSTRSQVNATLEIRVNAGSYSALASGAASSALALNKGTNTIDVKVTAQDGTTVKTYTLTVVRQIEQLITFNNTASVAYGIADFDPGATSSNTGIALSYVSSDPSIATIVAGKVHIIKVGTVNITASQAGNGTYVAASDRVQALTIQPKSITLSLNATPTITKTYEGSITATLGAGNYTLNGIESGDLVTVSGTGSFDTKDAGTGKSVTVNSFVLAGAQKDNYSLSTTSLATTGMITAKSITLSLNASPAISKTYDGSITATLAAGNYILNGIETGDAVTVSGTATFDNKDTGTGKTITANNFVLTGAQKDNYSLSTSSATVTGAIAAKNITLSLIASPAIAKTYDGTTTAVLTAGNYILNGIQTGDAVKVSGTAAFDTRNAGEGKTVTAGSFVLSGEQKDNYILSTLTAGTSGSIEKKVLTVKADDQSRRQGEANPVFTLSYSGFINGEGTGDLLVSPAASSTASATSVPGTYPIIPRGGSAANYNFSYVDGTLTIGSFAFVNTAPTLDVIPDRTVCYSNAPQTIALSGITAGAGDAFQNTILTVTSSNSALFGSLSIAKGASGTAVLTYQPASKAGGRARVTVTVSDDGGTANGGADSFSRSFDLMISSLPVAVIKSDAGTAVSKGTTVVLTASGGVNYIWASADGMVSGENTAVLTVRPFENTTYTVTASSGPGCTSVESITIRVLEDYNMVPTNFLTPNGDGKNDTWVIKNIDAYPNNRVTVFDAAGRPVYQKKGYINSHGWAGDVNGSPLTEGSYFYVIDFGIGGQVINGFITLLKDR